MNPRFLIDSIISVTDATQSLASNPDNAKPVMGYDLLPILIELIVFAVCLLISAFLSGSETALTSMSKLRVKRMFQEGEDAYKKLEPWLKDPNRFLATILVGNNFVNILASVVSADLFARILDIFFNISHAVAIASTLAVAASTFLLLIFGEIVPKTYSKEHAVRISNAVIGPLDLIYRMLRPLIRFFLVISNGIIRLFGGHTIKELPLLTEDDFRTLIEVSEKEGILEEDEREMIHSIIDFGETCVKEIMTPRVDFQVIDSRLSLEEVRREAIDRGHSRIPVYEGNIDNIIGVLYVKDLLKIRGDESSFKLQDILRPTLFVPEMKKVDDLLRKFQSEKNHLAMVVDEYGTIEGLVTIEDVLEEIVGEIQDEYDTEEPDFEQLNDGTIIASAKADLDDLEEVLDLEFPQNDVETLGGFISTIVGTVPAVGEHITYEDLTFTILDADERRINKVKIERSPPKTDSMTIENST